MNKFKKPILNFKNKTTTSIKLNQFVYLEDEFEQIHIAQITNKKDDSAEAISGTKKFLLLKERLWYSIYESKLPR